MWTVKPELSGYGVGCFTKKNAFFVFCFVGRFWPRVGVFSCFLVFFCFFMVVSGTNASCGTKEALVFENFWHSLFLRRLLAESFFSFFIMHDVPSSFTMGNTHVQLCIYDEMGNRGVMGATHI